MSLADERDQRERIVLSAVHFQKISTTVCWIRADWSGGVSLSRIGACIVETAHKHTQICVMVDLC